MVRQKINKFAFYRYRYVLAYVVFAVALATMLLIAGFYLPGGLSQPEIQSALISDNLNPTQLFHLQPDQLIYLPYRLLQAGSISLFGMTILGIKLPSIILGFLSALGILYLLNLWYRRNVAIIGSIIAVTTNQFLLSSQSGEAGVAYIFLTTMILIAASMISRRSAYARLLVIVGAVLAAASLYMPLNVYVLVALVTTALVHPHARHMLFRQAAKPIVLLGAFLFLVIISPLVYGIIQQPELLRILLGFSDGIGKLAANTATLLNNYTNFNTPASGEIIAPVYGLGLVVLLALGLYRLFSAKYTARSYILSFWLVLLIPLVCLNPGFVSITFVPVVLLIALAVDYLIRSWYRLFPNNPYARIFGLLPLGVLVLGLVVSSVDRYVYGLHYDAAVYQTYSYDLALLRNKLQTIKADEPVRLVVAPKNANFYKSFAQHQRHIKSLTVSTDTSVIGDGVTTIVERSMKQSITTVPSDILVTRTAHQGDRFYLYKKS